MKDTESHLCISRLSSVEGRCVYSKISIESEMMMGENRGMLAGIFARQQQQKNQKPKTKKKK